MAEILFVEYCAKDFLDGTLNMEPLTELAYRRICDMISATNDKLLDADNLKFATKTGNKWKKIRQELIDLEKIYIENGYIRNKTCTEKLAKSRANIEQKRAAGKSSAEKRKSLENNETGSTAVVTPEPTGVPTNQKPKDPIKEKDKKENISFEDFKKVYPRKDGLEGALASWSWAIQTGADPSQILRGAENYAKTADDRRDEKTDYNLGAKSFIENKEYLREDLQAEPSKPLDLGELTIWQQSIVNAIGAVPFNGWFKDAELADRTLIVRNKLAADQIKQKYLTPCREIFNEVEVRA